MIKKAVTAVSSSFTRAAAAHSRTADWFRWSSLATAVVALATIKTGFFMIAPLAVGMAVSWWILQKSMGSRELWTPAGFGFFGGLAVGLVVQAVLLGIVPTVAMTYGASYIVNFVSSVAAGVAGAAGVKAGMEQALPVTPVGRSASASQLVPVAA